MGAVDNYLSALERLKNNTPVVLPKGTRISKDTVALEAGRKRSSIKKSRPQFASLIEEIELAASIQSKPEDDSKGYLDKLKSEKDHYKSLYQQSLNRELMLVKRLSDLEKLLSNEVGKNNVHNIRA
ncbi:hypothetical protein H4J50_01590 [Colwellia sp. 6M3]|jgi:hypothetical protein|uniref:hypothetical protein n=1 Tax=Alteromonadales TaxID=135622 RepID=UPI0015F4ACC7|nr:MULTISPECIES: hypothetical protein [Alteromonadales]MBA6414697.1 hypothetical protein [Colwellia sp. 6M3]URQ85537.1 hypothetical protein J8Z28_13360 [Pseudoalteromonas sp. SCSIO 43088]|tara:strand:- start:145 stop:522 length:378 start_codon:yes stop_codon:yes gene_type:complete